VSYTANKMPLTNITNKILITDIEETNNKAETTWEKTYYRAGRVDTGIHTHTKKQVKRKYNRKRFDMGSPSPTHQWMCQNNECYN